MPKHLRLIKNAVANLLRGGSTTLVSIFLPAVLARHMPRAEYAVWVLVLQVAAYCIYLELGFQVAVGRYLAYARAKNDQPTQDSIYTTALAGLLGCFVLAAVLIGAVTLAAPHLFPSTPPALLGQLRAAMLIVGLSVAAGLPSFAPTGVFVGYERNEFVALISGGAKLLGGAAVAWRAVHHDSLIAIACWVAGINLASYLLLFLCARSATPVRVRVGLLNRATARELLGYCFSLMLWNLSMLLINGLDLTLVGRFDFAAVIPYAIAASVVNAIQGIQLAVFQAMMPRAAALHAEGDARALARLMLSSTRLGLLLVLTVSMPLLVYSAPLFHVWVGQQYVTQGRTFLYVLTLANILRLVAVPYANLLIATGQQRLVTISPLLEGLTNLIASITLGHRYGAIGIAYGTLLGAIIGLAGHLLYNIPRTRTHIQVTTARLLSSGMALPLLITSPIIFLAIHARHSAPPSFAIAGALLGLTLLGSAALLLRDRSAPPTQESLPGREAFLFKSGPD